MQGLEGTYPDHLLLHIYGIADPPAHTIRAARDGGNMECKRDTGTIVCLYFVPIYPLQIFYRPGKLHFLLCFLGRLREGN